MSLKLLNWNVDWTKSEWKAAETKYRIDRQAADIICLTETDTNRLTLPEHGHSICAGDDWGIRNPDSQKQLSVRCMSIASRRLPLEYDCFSCHVIPTWGQVGVCNCSLESVVI